MKKSPIFYLLLLSLCVVGCTNDETSLPISTSATAYVESVNSITFDQDIEDLLSDAVELSTSSGKTVTSLAKGPSRFHGDRYGRCATVTHDEENNRKTIVFSGECNGWRGQSRTGTIVITYSEERDSLGSFRQTEFDDFYMNDVKIEGIRRKEIIALDEQGNKTSRSSLTGGKMIYEDGTFSSREKNFTRYTVTENNERQYTILNGSSSGVSSDGTNFSLTIDSPIKFLYSCFSTSRFHKRGRVPVEGVKTLVSGSDTIITDFGDGSCDFNAVVTTNGVSETIDLSTKRRGGKLGKF